MPHYLNLRASFNFVIFIAFCLGIILAKYFTIFWFFLIFWIVSTSLVFFFYKKRTLFISDFFVIVLFFSLGGMYSTVDSLSYLNLDKLSGKKLPLVIKVSSFPKNYLYQNTFLAQIKKIKDLKTNLKVKVIDYTKKLDYLNSYKLEAKIVKRKQHRHTFYLVFIKKDEKVVKLKLSLLERFMLAITKHFKTISSKNLTDQSYRFLSSIFLGRRELLTDKEKEIFVNAGLSHLLAISGTHIGFSAIFLFFLFKFFGLRFKVRLFLSTIFLFLYSLLVGLNPATTRAFIMYSVFVISFFIKRRVNLFNSLGLAGLTCLIAKPYWLFDVSFQLSFLSVFSLILGFEIFNFSSLKMPILRYLTNLFFSSLFITLFVNPLNSYYFGKIYLLSVIYNVILIPLFCTILIANFVFLILPLKFLLNLIGESISFLVFLFYKISYILGSIKFSYIAYRFNFIQMVFYYIFLVIMIFAFVKRRALFNLIKDLLKHKLTI